MARPGRFASSFGRFEENLFPLGGGSPILKPEAGIRKSRAPASRRTLMNEESARDGTARALAYSRDSLDACIELISEGKPAPVMMIMEELKRDIISKALIMSRSNIRAAAGLLGIKYTTLYAQVKKYERQCLAARLNDQRYIPAGDVAFRS